MTTTLNVAITFDSDWIIGAGYSRSKRVDQAILRDAEGLPYVPAKTLVGLLRHRAAQVATALDDGDTGRWHDWHEFVFGTRPTTEDKTSHRRRAPVPSALRSAPLTMTAAFRQAGSEGRFGILTAEEVAQAAGVVRAAVAIDPEYGSARPDTVRFEERARAGLTVSAVWTLESAGADLWPAKLLLGSAASLITAVGGNRRRGAGEATVSVGIDHEVLTRNFGRVDSVPAAPQDAGSKPVDQPSGPAASGNRKRKRKAKQRPVPTVQPAKAVAQRDDPAVPVTDRRDYDVTVTLRHPAIVDATVTANNVETSLLISGSVLLPLVLRAVEVPPHAVRDGAIRISDATVDIDGKRGMVWPLSLTTDKTAPDAGARIITHEHESNPKNKAKVGNFVVASGDSLRTAKPELVQRLHAVVGDETQGPEDLYSTSALPVGTVLRAVLTLGPGSVLKTLEQDVRIGRASKDDYGLARMTIAPATASVVEPQAITQGTPFSIYLESDVVLIDGHGAYAPTVEQLIVSLNERLDPDIRLTVEQPMPDGSKPKATANFPNCVSITRLDGWQTKWGLPRPTVAALAAGSVISVMATGDLDQAQVEALAQPVGWRQAEGKGRIQVNPGWLSQARVTESSVTSAPQSSAPADRAAVESITPLIRAALRERADNAALRAATSSKVRDRYVPNSVTNAQLGVLRGLAENLKTEEGRNSFNSWVAESKNDAQWRNVMEPLATLVGDPTTIWKELFRAELGDREPALPAREDVCEAERMTSISALLVYIIRKRFAEAAK
ncbi:MAG: RAMP superfamily CRISPR-associated protein [Gordonia sp. (in: high G+C Gram-positive bacteria)]